MKQDGIKMKQEKTSKNMFKKTLGLGLIVSTVIALCAWQLSVSYATSSNLMGFLPIDVYHGYVMARPKNDDPILNDEGKPTAPVPGVLIHAGASLGAESYSHTDGAYGLIYRGAPCPLSSYSYTDLIAAEFYPLLRPRYPTFTAANTYIPVTINCFGFDALLALISPTTLTAAVTKIQLLDILSNVPDEVTHRINIFMDTMFLFAFVGIQDKKESNIPLGEITDYNDKGLLKSIRQEDLENTSLYVYNRTRDEMIAEYSQLDLSPNSGVLEASLPILGPDYNVIYRALSEAGQTWTNPAVFPRYDTELGQAANRARPCDIVEVFALNRATGYFGSALTTLKSIGTLDNDQTQPECQNELPDPDPTFNDVHDDNLAIVSIVMQPPNIKVKAERVYDQDLGKNEAGEERRYLIGFEGSALTRDNIIRITTEWGGPGGNFIPDEIPGFTGRLARIVKKNSTPGPDLSEVETFTILPGINQQWIRAQGNNPNQSVKDEHYYVHICAEAPGLGTPCDFSSIRTEEPLIYRPQNTVPFLILNKGIRIDENQITDATDTDGDGIPNYYEEQLGTDPLNSSSLPDDEDKDGIPDDLWVYNHELHFSLFDLDIKKIDLLKKDATNTVDIYSSGAVISWEDQRVDIQYRLRSPYDAEILPPLEVSNPRELVFSLGDEQVVAQYENQNTASFTDLAQIQDFLNNASADEILAFQLTQSTDIGNVLWEWEVRTPQVILHSLVESEAMQNTRIIESDLKDNYFYPQLGNKKVFVQMLGFGQQDEVKIIAVKYDADDTNEQNIFTTAPAIDTPVTFDSEGYAKFLLLGGITQNLAPVINNPNREITVRFELASTETPPAYDPIEVDTKIILKNNSNVTLEDVLDGEAVFTATSFPSESEGLTLQERQNRYYGKTTGAQTSEQYYDYVEYMSNMITIPLIEMVRESNLRYSIIPDGWYGYVQSTAHLLALLSDPDDGIIIPGFEVDKFAVGPVLSHFEPGNRDDNKDVPSTEEFKSFRKLLQDYQGSTIVNNLADEKDITQVPSLNFESYMDEIITPEIMRGTDLNDEEGRTIAEGGDFTDDDLGLYELYLSYDWDGDGVSNLAEVENATNGTFNENLFNPLDQNNNGNVASSTLINAYNRGYWSFPSFDSKPTPPSTTIPPYTPSSSAFGIGEISSSQTGETVTGLRIPTFSTGFYDMGNANNPANQPQDDKNKDSYTTLPVLNMFEEAGRRWTRLYPDTYPLELTPQHHADNTDIAHIGQARMGINDISANGGGFNRSADVAILRAGRTLPGKALGHSSHHNGLDVDLRFVALPNTTSNDLERSIDLSIVSQRALFDATRTEEMLETITAAAATQGLTPRIMYLAENQNQIPSNSGDDVMEDFCDAVGLTFNTAAGGECKYLAGHKNHIHLRFQIADQPRSLLSTSVANPQQIEISFNATTMEGATEIHSFDIIDEHGQPLLSWTRVTFVVVGGTNDATSVLSVRSTHPNQDHSLWVNHGNTVSNIGNASLSFQCLQSSADAQTVQLKDRLTAQIFKTIEVTCSGLMP